MDTVAIRKNDYLNSFDVQNAGYRLEQAVSRWGGILEICVHMALEL